METPNLSDVNQELTQEIELPQIPDQIIRELLSRLPVKSLIRFKCVRRAWHSLISDPKFTLKTNLYRAILWSKTNPFLCSISHDLHEENIPSPLVNIMGSLDQKRLFLGSCNGLVLFSVSASIYLWNPSTRSCKEVVQLNLLNEDILVASSICFDESIDDYKIVIVLYPVAGGRKAILATSKRKEWMQLTFPYNTFSAIPGPGPVVNGYIHWIVREEKGGADLIIYFESRTNRFIKLPMPYFDVGDSTDIFRLGVLDGCLSLARLGNIWNLEYVTEILVMREDGVQESWMTVCSITLEGPQNWLPPLFYIKGSNGPNSQIITFFFNP